MPIGKPCVAYCANKNGRDKRCGNKTTYIVKVKFMYGVDKGKEIKLSLCTTHISVLSGIKTTYKKNGNYKVYGKPRVRIWHNDETVDVISLEKRPEPKF